MTQYNISSGTLSIDWLNSILSLLFVPVSAAVPASRNKLVDWLTDKCDDDDDIEGDSRWVDREKVLIYNTVLSYRIISEYATVACDDVAM